MFTSKFYIFTGFFSQVIHSIYLFGCGIWLIAISSVLLGYSLEFIRILGKWDYLEMNIPFWVFFSLGLCSCSVVWYFVQQLRFLGRYNIVFHFIFVFFILNFIAIVVFDFGFYVPSYLPFLVGCGYIICIVFGSSWLVVLGLLIGVTYVVFSFWNAFSIFLLFSNVIVYRASRRRHRFRKKFFHTFIPSFVPAQRLITLFYKQFDDTIFIWDYNLFIGTWIYVGLSFLVFCLSSSIYFWAISVSFGNKSVFRQFFIIACGGCLASIGVYCLWRFLIFLNPLYLPTAFIEFCILLARLGHLFDSQSYFLFFFYGLASYIILRLWIVVFRWFASYIARREYVIDLDYKTIRPIIYGRAKFPLFWNFHEVWFQDIFIRLKAFRRSIPPDAPEDANYYYGGPNPNMIIFNPYTGFVIQLFVSDLIHENYRIYYKLYKFAKQKPAVSLFLESEKRWTFKWLRDEFRIFSSYALRVFAPYYYYTRYDLKSDYILNRLLVYDDVTKVDWAGIIAEPDENEKSFFDSHLWQSVWLKGFGRPMPSPIPINSDLQNFLNRDLDVFFPISSKFFDDVREDYQELLMFRRRYLFRQEINVHRSIGFFPNELYAISIENCDNPRLIATLSVSNFFFASLRMFTGFGTEYLLGSTIIGKYVISVVQDLYDLYFYEIHQYIPFRQRTRNSLWSIIHNFYNFDSTGRSKFVLYSVLFKIVLQIFRACVLIEYFDSSMLSQKLYQYYWVHRLSSGFFWFLEHFHFQLISLLIIQLSCLGFCGLDLRCGDDKGIFLFENSFFKHDYFDLLNNLSFNFEDMFLNFPNYDCVVKKDSRFFGVFEDVSGNFPGFSQKRFNRFCFVNSRLALENDRESKFSNFFINFDTWLAKFGGFNCVGFDFLIFLRLHYSTQFFGFGNLVHDKYTSILVFFRLCLSLFRLGGLSSSNREAYRFSIFNFDVGYEQLVEEPKFLEYTDWLYRKLPFDGYKYSVYFGLTYEFINRWPIFQNFSTLGCDLPLSYMFTTVDSFYLNSFVYKSLGSQFFSANYINKFYQQFHSKTLYFVRFRAPMFHSLFDSWFCTAELKFGSFNPVLINSFKSNYLKVKGFREFIKFSSKFFNIMLFSVYWFENFNLNDLRGLNSYYNILKLIKYCNIFLRFHTRAWLVHSSEFRNLIASQQVVIFPIRTFLGSRKWVYRWGSKFVWSTNIIGKCEYYSFKEYPRLFESFNDCVEISLLNHKNAVVPTFNSYYLRWEFFDVFYFNRVSSFLKIIIFIRFNFTFSINLLLIKK